jgi:abortive infection bacteriophage resistance protein
MPLDKGYSSYRKQLQILRARGLSIPLGSRASRAIRILEHENYYNLINGYKEPFLDSSITTTERYLPGADFFEIYALYEFDREARNIFLSRILRVETHVKSVISHEFSKKYGHDNYLKLSNFKIIPGNKKTLEQVSKLISSVNGNISTNIAKSHQAVLHYMQEYGYIPLWVLVNVLTFGVISTFYQNMKDQDRNIVARRLNVTDMELKTILTQMTLLRNICAHDERLYNFKTNRLVVDTRIHASMGLRTNPQGQYIRGKGDLFAVMISLKLLQNKKEMISLTRELDDSLNKLGRQLTSISLNNILAIMGFPTNWKDIVRV